LIKAMVEIKRRNPRFGCHRIALIITNTFGVEINKDIVRRILIKHYHPDPGDRNGPSWLSLIAHMKEIVSGASICPAVNRFRLKRTGYWW
jgi:hypothetical protein